jgi:thymidylate kinase
MIIIIEGADGTGKTTLSKKLIEKLQAKYIHLTWSRELDVRMLEYQTEALIEAYEYVLNINKPCIIDRHWISELIYSKVFRHGTRMPGYGEIVEKFIEAIGGFTILCLSTNLEKHKQRYELLKGNRIEMYTDVSEVVTLYNVFYNNVKTNKNYIKYEIEEEGRNIDEFVNQIRDELNLRQGVRRF